MALLEPLKCWKVGTPRIPLILLNSQGTDENCKAKVRYGNSLFNVIRIKTVLPA